MLKYINSLLKAKVKVTIFTSGGVVSEVKCNVPIEYTIKDLDDIPPLCMTCGVRCNGLTDLCINGHDDWLEELDVEAKNEHYERAVRQSGYGANSFEQMFHNPKNKFIKQDIKK